MRTASSPRPRISPRYEGLEAIGSGATGSVYKARDSLLDREVAIKVLSTQDASADEIDYFKQEFQTVVELKHPNLIQVFDFGQTPSGELFYSMEFLPAGALSSFTLPAERELLLSAIVQVCRALQYIHSKGITHLDVKPENVLIGSRTAKGGLHLKLTDFGLASLPRGSSGARAYGGTPAYAAPEVIAQAAVDYRADLFSLGAMAYELATAHLPFSRQDAAGTAVRPPRPSSLNPALGRDVDTLILKLLELDPANRYRDANAVIEAINRLFQEKFAVETEKTSTSYVLTPALVGRDKEVEIIRRELAALAKVRLSPEDVPADKEGTVQAHGRSGERGASDGPVEYQAGASSADSAGGQRPRHHTAGEAAQDEPHRQDAGFIPTATAGLVLITGQTGIGKSRLVQDVKIFSQLNRVTFCAGHSVSGSLMPAAAVIEALRSLMGALPTERRPDPGAALAGLISSKDAGQAAEFSDASSFAESVYQFLRSASGLRPIVLCVEDLHWADPLTLKALGHLARGLFLTTLGQFSPDIPCRLIVTLDDSVSVAKELRALLKEWEEAPFVRHLKLKPLSAAEVGGVVSSMFGPQALPAGVAESLHAATAGVPLYLQQLIAQLLKDGAIRQELGRWKLGISQLTDLPVPKGTRQRAKAVMAGLTAEQAKVMRVLSVLVTPAAADKTAALAKIPYRNARGILRELSHRALIAHEKNTYYISDGPLKKSIYSSMGRDSRRRLHLDAAALIEASPIPQRVKVHSLAQHYLAAQDTDGALKWGLAAARDSMGAQANKEAASYYESLVKLKLKPALRAELLTEYGQTLARMADHEGAIKAYEGALGTKAKIGASAKAKLLRLTAEAYQENSDILQSRRFFKRATWLKAASHDEVALATARLAVLEHDAGKRIPAEKQMARALALVRGQRTTHAVSSHVHRIAGSILAERDRPNEAMPHLREALRHAVAAHDLAAQSSTYTSLTWAYYRLAEYGRSRQAALASLRIARRLGNATSRAYQLLNLGGVHYRNGEYGTAIEQLLEASSFFKRAGSLRLHGLCLGNLGLIAIEMGQYETSFAYLRRALSIQEARGYAIASLRSRSAMVTGLIQTGLLDEAFALVTRLVKNAEETRVSHDLYMAKKKLADIHLLRGRPSEAEILLKESLQGFTEIGEKDEMCECLARLAAIEEEAGNRASSASYLSQAKPLARALKSKPIELMVTTMTTPRASRDILRIEKLAMEIESPELRWRAHAACARYHLDRDNLPAAIEEYDKCVAVFRSVAADIQDESLRRSYLAHPERSRILEEIKSVKQRLYSAN